MVASYADDVTAARERFSVFAVMSDAAKLYARYVVPIFVVVLITELIKTAIVLSVFYGFVFNIRMSGFLVALYGAMFVRWLLYSISAAIIANMIMNYYKNDRIYFFSSIGSGLARSPIVMLIGLLVAIPAIVVVFLLFVVFFSAGSTLGPVSGGASTLLAVVEILIAVGFLIFLALYWYVGPVAAIFERLGPINSLRRSAQLTRGLRWHILGILVICVPIIVLPDLYGRVASRGLGYAYPILQLSVICLTWGFLLLVPSVTFHHLRRAKEGGDIGNLSGIFD